MNINTSKVRPDTLTKGDYIYNPMSVAWEPVKDAYWSEETQRYVVWCGILGGILHTYSKGILVQRQRYYSSKGN